MNLLTREIIPARYDRLVLILATVVFVAVLKLAMG